MQTAPNLIGESSAFLSVLDKTSHLAQIHRPILILGERGTGKELIAQRLHYLSPRWQSPLLSLNSSSLVEDLVESELFGHEAGAFTGAKSRHKGRFERAKSGSLFLDELGNLPISTQNKLLRVIEYGEYETVGGNQIKQTDARLICATNQNLPQLVRQGKFKADLLDRLAFDVIFIPPLRDRKEDILPLVEHFAISMSQEIGLDFFAGFSDAAWQQLLDYHWPGNVRELKNVVERTIYHHSTLLPIQQVILDPFEQMSTSLLTHEALDLNLDQKSHLPNSQTTNVELEKNSAISFPIDLKLELKEQEKNYILSALKEAQYNQKKASQLLKLSYDQFRGMLRKHQIK